MGIGKMSEGLATLVTSAKDSGDSMIKLGLGVGTLAASMALFSVGSLGLLTFATTLGMISKNAENISKVGNAFKEINTVMSGSKEDYIAIANAINSISNANSKNNGLFKDLSNLLKTPLKVEFADKNIAIVSNITLNMDGHKFTEMIGVATKTAIKAKEIQTGQSSESPKHT